MAKRLPRAQGSEVRIEAPQAQPHEARDTRAGSMGSEPSEEEIRVRAYLKYLERGAGDGQAFDDWVRAEQELKVRT